MREAKNKVMGMINDDLSRVHIFDKEAKIRKDNHLMKINEDDLDIEKFDNPDASHSTIIHAPASFRGTMKDY